MLPTYIRALYVEDCPMDFELLRRAFSHATICQVSLQRAKTLSEALERLQNCHYNIILLDLILPDAQGLAMLDGLRAIAPQVPIIVITGLAEEKLALKAAKKGAQDCLIKGSHLMPPFMSGLAQAGANHLARLLIYSIERVQLTQQLTSAEERYIQERELAHITLQAIGEAVISTDAEGNLRSLNPAAELLTGWTEAEAKGQNIACICQIVDGEKGISLENPALAVLREGQSASLARHPTLISRDHRKIAISYSTSPIYSKDNKIVGAVLVFHDVTEESRRAQKLQWQAAHDMLTGLWNRQGFMRELEAALSASEAEGQMHCLCYFDLDHFKIVNDTCGHSAGDELLRQLSAMMLAEVRKSDTLARLGGDEFALLLHNCTLEIAVNIAQKFCTMIEQYRFVWDQKIFKVSASIGVVAIDAHCLDAETVMQWADKGCYAAKHHGKGRVYVYQPQDPVHQRDLQTQWFSRLTQALEEEKFQLYLQRIDPVSSPNLPKLYEVLVRLVDSQGNLVLPSAFIACAERYNLMTKIDRYVIKTLFRYLSTRSVEESSVYCIHVSRFSLSDPFFVSTLLGYFEEYGVNPQQICFGIAETVAIANLTETSKFLQQLKVIGCQFALDDFGSGLSSLAYLKQLPVDFLKIDSSFVKDICYDPVTCTLVEMINKLGHTLKLKTVAEHVSDQAIFRKLEQLGLDYVQGHAVFSPCQALA